MAIRRPIALGSTFEFRAVVSDEDGAIFGDIAERGYERPGLAWLLSQHDS
jgi:hypothetical protein